MLREYEWLVVIKVSSYLNLKKLDACCYERV